MADRHFECRKETYIRDVQNYNETALAISITKIGWLLSVRDIKKAGYKNVVQSNDEDNVSLWFRGFNVSNVMFTCCALSYGVGCALERNI